MSIYGLLTSLGFKQYCDDRRYINTALSLLQNPHAWHHSHKMPCKTCEQKKQQQVAI